MILAVLQARVSSSRLPGKVLKPILGQPMILHQINRVQRSRKIDKLIVATSTDSSDDALADMCAENRIDCYRGSLDDVLDRFYRAALKFGPEHLVRLTGDCPLADPTVIDDAIVLYQSGQFDYVSNGIEPTYPDGLDVEVFSIECLASAWKEAKLKSQREHVTLFIWQQPERFKIGHLKNKINLSHLRWTVDEAEDFELICKIYNKLFRDFPHFTTTQILDLLEKNPEFSAMNKSFVRNEGLKKSIEEDMSGELK